MKSSRYEISFSGSGGQGIITAAVIMADAVGTLDGKYVCQTQSYGPEARGGKSKAEVVISSNDRLSQGNAYRSVAGDDPGFLRCIFF